MSWISGGHDMRLKMYLVYFPPEQVRVGCVTKVIKIPITDYDDKLPYQESYAPGELLETKTHYRWKGHSSSKYFAVPAFQLCPEGDELLTEYCFGYATNANKEDFHKFAGPDEQGLYFDMPKLKKEKGVFRLTNTLAGASLGSIQPGNTKLLIRDSDGNIIFSWNLTIWPSSLEKKEFQRMIDEILCIDRQLLQFRPGKKEDIHSASKLGLNLKRMTATELWEQTLEDMERDVIELDRLLKRMEKRPHFALRTEAYNCQFHQVKHINQDILRQYIQQPSRQYYHTSKAAKSLDIYEHRFLKQTLGQLLGFFERHSDSLSIASDSVETQKSILLGKMRQIIGGNVKENQLLINWDHHVKKIRLQKEQMDRQKDQFSAKFVQSYEQNQYTPSNTAHDRISFRVTRLSTDSIKCTSKELRLVYTPQREKDNLGKSYMIELNGCPNTTCIKNIIFDTWDIGSQYAFYHGIIEEAADDEEVSVGIKIDAVGNFKIHPIDDKGDTHYKIIFYKLDELYIDDKSVSISKPKTSEWIQQVKALSDAYGIARCFDEHISLKYGEMESIESQRQILKNTPTKDYLRERNNSRLGKIRQKIEALQNSTLFADLSTKSNISIPWKMTQIFTNDKNYNAAYKLLLDMDKRYDFTLEVTDEFIIHEKLDKLYEYWVLSKILEYLILVQGWKSDGASPSKILRNFFRQDKRTKPACISLHHEGIQNLRLDIYYDTPVKYSVGVSADAQDQDADKLQPDFLFRLSHSEKSMYFILDAKYRDYAAMGGCLDNLDNQQNNTYWWKKWKKDMYDVCYEWYFKRLPRIGVPVYAAFIAHSDKKGMSKYVTYDAKHDKRCENLFDETTLKQSFEVCRIGSFYMVPNGCNNESGSFNQTSQNLQAFFQMLCEDYAGAWNQCWQCGSTDVEKEVLHTKKGYNKYHLRCKECHAFWVKTHCFSCGTNLVKHDFNHYVESKLGNHWMVVCPSCDSSAEKKEENPIQYIEADFEDDCPF